jgi:hypothetical protein
MISQKSKLADQSATGFGYGAGAPSVADALCAAPIAKTRTGFSMSSIQPES